MSATDKAEVREENRRTLFVLLHGFGQRASSLDPIVDRICRALPRVQRATDIFAPQLPLCALSRADADEVVAQVLREVDARWERSHRDREPYKSVVLVGHSVGAMLARKLYVVASGETQHAPFEPVYKQGRPPGLMPARPWAPAVDRILLMAGTNRGWRLNHHLGFGTAAWMAAGIALAGVLALFGRPPIIMSFRRGATFLTQLRIQWVRMRYRAETEPLRPGKAVTIQLLGSRDDIVGPEDNIDLVSGGDFLYLDVKYSGHRDIVDLDDPAHGRDRARAFRLALVRSKDRIRKAAVVPSDESFGGTAPHIKDVVFVMHGIRDAGYWTHKVARHVRKRAGLSQARWATETSSYGYFPMLPFILPWTRRTKVEWFMDQYAEAAARYPCAEFSFVGHSNGTYLLAKALQLYPCCKFKHVAFAGSVVRSEYDWGRYLDSPEPQVKSVLNLVATRDWVVAFFPKLFQLVRVQDLGSAGHDGFALAASHPAVHEIVAVKGGHGAGVAEALWDTLAQFVLTGNYNDRRLPTLLGPHARAVRWIGKAPYLVWAAIATVLFAVAMLAVAGIRVLLADGAAEQFWSGFAIALYLGLLWVIATRV